MIDIIGAMLRGLLQQRYERNKQIGSVLNEQFQLLLHVNIKSAGSEMEADF